MNDNITLTKEHYADLVHERAELGIKLARLEGFILGTATYEDAEFALKMLKEKAEEIESGA